VTISASPQDLQTTSNDRLQSLQTTSQLLATITADHIPTTGYNHSRCHATTGYNHCRPHPNYWLQSLQTTSQLQATITADHIQEQATITADHIQLQVTITADHIQLQSTVTADHIPTTVYNHCRPHPNYWLQSLLTTPTTGYNHC